MSRIVFHSTLFGFFVTKSFVIIMYSHNCRLIYEFKLKEVDSVFNCMEHRPPWKANHSSASQAFVRISWILDIHQPNTTVRRFFLSWTRAIKSTLPETISLTSISILSSHRRLGFPSGLFPSGFLTATFNAPLVRSTRESVLKYY